MVASSIFSALSWAAERESICLKTPYDSMSYQLRSCLASLESVSLFVLTALKHVENNPEVDGSGPLNTQPNDKRTATEVFLRSESKNSSGRIKWNTS